MPNIQTNRLHESRQFYTTLLGFQVAMDMGWIVTLASPNNPTAQISLVRDEKAPPENANVILTIEVGDIDAVHTEAFSHGYQIVDPLTDEPWWVRRFHVRDPNGVVINVMGHLE